jgi:hypothetical protein
LHLAANWRLKPRRKHGPETWAGNMGRKHGLAGLS